MKLTPDMLDAFERVQTRLFKCARMREIIESKFFVLSHDDFFLIWRFHYYFTNFRRKSGNPYQLERFIRKKVKVETKVMLIVKQNCQNFCLLKQFL